MIFGCSVASRLRATRACTTTSSAARLTQTTSSSRPSSRRGRAGVPSTCRPASGTTSGAASGWPAPQSSSPTPRSSGSRSSSAPAPSSRSATGRSAGIPGRGPRGSTRTTGERRRPGLRDDLRGDWGASVGETRRATSAPPSPRYRLTRASRQRLLDPLFVCFERDHLVREALDRVPAEGFEIEFVERAKLGIIGRVAARKPYEGASMMSPAPRWRGRASAS